MISRARALSTFGLTATLACTGPASDGERPLELVLPTEIATVDPRFATRGLDVKVTRLVHAGLVGLEPDTLRPTPLVAQSWHFVSERELAITLRPGVRFHSGQELGPEDVCATLAAVADPALGSPHRSIVDALGACTPTGPRELTLRLARPRATLLTDLELPVLRRDQARAAPHADLALDGLGPYRIVHASPSEIALAPADTGVARAPRRHVVVRVVRDENARALRLLAGRADLAPNAVSPALLPALRGRHGLEVVARPGANVTYLLFQNDRAPFDDVTVRHAVAHALDRELVANTLLGGHATTAAWLLPPEHWAGVPGLRPIPYDPERARARLAGLAPVTLLTSTDRARVTIARALAQMLNDVGLPTRVVPLDLGVLLARLDAGDFSLAVLQFPELTEPNVLHWFFHRDGVPGEGGQGKNRARYRSVAASTLLERGARERDEGERLALYRALADQMRTDLPVVPLWHEDQIAIVSPRAAGFRPSAEGRWAALAAY